MAGGLTVMVVTDEKAPVQMPFCIKVLYCVVAVKLVYCCDVVVLPIVVHVVPLSVENSHLIIFPACPERVIVPPLLPEHTVASVLVVPPTVGASSVITTELEFVGQGAAAVIVQVNW